MPLRLMTQSSRASNKRYGSITVTSYVENAVSARPHLGKYWSPALIPLWGHPASES